MKYHMTTTKGISEEYNSHSQEEPMYGSGQGATDGPVKWTLKDNGITKTYNKKAPDCRMHNPRKSIQKKQNSARFMDDATKLHNVERFDIKATKLMHQNQTDVNLHGRYLWVSGGHLELNKAIYDLLIWKFDKWGRPRLWSDNELPKSKVKVIEATGIKVQLQQADVNITKRMLGVWQAVALQMETEFNIQLGKPINFDVRS
eukprot:3609056-Ditylum_brightwellii.AAC.1